MAYKGLHGKVAIVTGAAGGIGAATCRRLVEEGCRVAGVDVKEAPLAKLKAALPDVLTIVADVSREEDVAAYVRETAAAFGAVHLFVNNAAILGARVPLAEMAVADFDAVHAVNVRGAFLGLREVLRQMRKQGQGGAIVNTASIGGLNSQPLSCAYGSSKRALIGLSNTAAAENGDAGIRVNAICPGAVDTDMLRPALGANNFEERMRAAPLQRAADPSEIAAFIAYLLSDEASYQTAGVYTIDGGMYR